MYPQYLAVAGVQFDRQPV